MAELHFIWDCSYIITYAFNQSDFIHEVLKIGNETSHKFVQKTEPKEFAYHATLYVGNEHRCFGVLISSKHVLTSAYCIYDIVILKEKNIEDLQVELEATGKKHSIFRASIHSNFRIVARVLPEDHDIAILQVFFFSFCYIHVLIRDMLWYELYTKLLIYTEKSIGKLIFFRLRSQNPCQLH